MFFDECLEVNAIEGILDLRCFFFFLFFFFRLPYTPASNPSFRNFSPLSNFSILAIIWMANPKAPVLGIPFPTL